PGTSASSAPSAWTRPGPAEWPSMSQMASLIACQMPFRMALPSAVRALRASRTGAAAREGWGACAAPGMTLNATASEETARSRARDAAEGEGERGGGEAGCGEAGSHQRTPVGEEYSASNELGSDSS